MDEQPRQRNRRAGRIKIDMEEHVAAPGSELARPPKPIPAPTQVRPTVRYPVPPPPAQPYAREQFAHVTQRAGTPKKEHHRRKLLFSNKALSTIAAFFFLGAMLYLSDFALKPTAYPTTRQATATAKPTSRPTPKPTPSPTPEPKYVIGGVAFSDEEQYAAFIEANGVKGLLSEKYSEQYKGKHVVFSGVVSRVSAYTSYVDMYGKDAEGYSTHFFPFAKSGGFSDFRSLHVGDGIEVQGYMDEKGSFTAYRFIKIPAPFTLEDVSTAFKESCVSYTYDEVARKPDEYRRKPTKFRGTVIQVVEEQAGRMVLRVGIGLGSSVFENVMYVSYAYDGKLDSRILDGDRIDMYGTLDGLKTYTAVLGQTITIPSFTAKYIDQADVIK